jgi:hypothetical protein
MKVALKLARKGPRRRRPLREPQFPRQAEVLAAFSWTATKLSRRCRITYIRARDLRAGRLILKPHELEQLPPDVQLELRAALPTGARVNRAEPQLALALEMSA